MEQPFRKQQFTFSPSSKVANKSSSTPTVNKGGNSGTKKFA